MANNEYPDSRRETQKDESFRQQVTQNGNSIFSNMEKLLKTLEENQIIIENRENKESQKTISK